MNTSLTRMNLLALLTAVVFAGPACLGPAEDGALERIRSTGIVRIGYAVEPPYAMISADGRITGESPELARLVAARMGIRRIEWIQTSFDALIADLQEDRFDLIAAGMFITPERRKAVLFSDPTLRVMPGLLVRAGTPAMPRSYDAIIARPALRIAALAGSVEEQQLRAGGLPADRLLSVPDAVAGRAAVESGAVDALALSLPTIRTMAQARPDTLEALPLEYSPSGAGTASIFHVAFAFSPRHGELRRAWNAAQAGVRGTPAHLQAIAPFGFDAASLPGPTAEEHAL